MNLPMKVPTEKVSTYLADLYRAVSTAMYFVMAEKRGLDLRELRVTTANDLLAWSMPSLLNYPPSPFQECRMPRIG